MEMRIFITGGTGFVGRYLSDKLLSDGHEVTVLSRGAKGSSSVHGGARVVRGDPTKPGDWQDSIGENDVVINLAGAPIFKRWSGSYKRTILDSRLRSTANLADAIVRAGHGSIQLLNASAVGYYGFREDETIDETGEPGTDFLARVAGEWEAATRRVSQSGSRVVLCRFGIVLGKGGGALQGMIENYRRRPVMVLGSGRQWFSWIHIEDLARIFLFLIDNADIGGPLNCVSPGAVRNRELTEHLAQRMHRKVIGMSLPGFALKLMLGEFAEVLLNGQRVVPRRLIDGGFTFRFPELDGALADLVEE
jgi:uncharacterized protein (TIGR01777 family)